MAILKGMDRHRLMDSQAITSECLGRRTYLV